MKKGKKWLLLLTSAFILVFVSSAFLSGNDLGVSNLGNDTLILDGTELVTNGNFATMENWTIAGYDPYSWISTSIVDAKLYLVQTKGNTAIYRKLTTTIPVNLTSVNTLVFSYRVVSSNMEQKAVGECGIIDVRYDIDDYSVVLSSGTYSRYSNSSNMHVRHVPATETFTTVSVVLQTAGSQITNITGHVTVTVTFGDFQQPGGRVDAGFEAFIDDVSMKYL